MHQRADRIGANETAVIEDLLKFGGRRRIRVRRHQRLTSHIGRVQTAKIVMTEVEPIDGQLIRKSDLQAVRSVCRPAESQRGQRVKNRDVSKFHERIFGEAFFQITGERL